MKQVLMTFVLSISIFCLCSCQSVAYEDGAQAVDELILETSDMSDESIALAREAYDALSFRERKLVENVDFLELVEAVEIDVYTLNYYDNLKEEFFDNPDTWCFKPDTQQDLFENYSYLTFNSSVTEIITTAFAGSGKIYTVAMPIDQETVHHDDHQYYFDGTTLSITPKWIGHDDQIYYGFILAMFVITSDLPIEIEVTSADTFFEFITHIYY